MEVTGLEAGTIHYFAIKVGDEWGNKGPVSNLASGMTLPPPTIATAVDPDPLVFNLLTGQTDSGTLTITTQVAERDAVIRFEDTGVGLPPEVERIFEPFFTTKEPGKGTGLGLAICKDIIEKYNGKILAENRNGGGSSFTIRIPLESCTRTRRDQTFMAGEPKAESLQLEDEYKI